MPKGVPKCKAKGKAAPTRTERFTTVMADLKKAKDDAKKTIATLRKQVRSEKQRHKRIIKKASMLGASELIEIAGLRQMTMAELSKYALEMGVQADHKQDETDDDVPDNVNTEPNRDHDRDHDGDAGSGPSHANPAPEAVPVH